MPAFPGGFSPSFNARPGSVAVENLTSSLEYQTKPQNWGTGDAPSLPSIPAGRGGKAGALAGLLNSSRGGARGNLVGETLGKLGDTGEQGFMPAHGAGVVVDSPMFTPPPLVTVEGVPVAVQSQPTDWGLPSFKPPPPPAPRAAEPTGAAPSKSADNTTTYIALAVLAVLLFA